MKAGWSAKGTKTTSEREQKRRGSWSLSHLVLLNPGDDSKASLEACERCAVSFGSVHLEKKNKKSGNAAAARGPGSQAAAPGHVLHTWQEGSGGHKPLADPGVGAAGPAEEEGGGDVWWLNRDESVNWAFFFF